MRRAAIVAFAVVASLLLVTAQPAAANVSGSLEVKPPPMEGAGPRIVPTTDTQTPQ